MARRPSASLISTASGSGVSAAASELLSSPVPAPVEPGPAVETAGASAVREPSARTPGQKPASRTRHSKAVNHFFFIVFQVLPSK